MIYAGKKILLITTLLLCVFLFAGCTQGALTEENQGLKGISPEDISAEYDEATAARIILGDSISLKGSGAELQKNVITIFKEGTYIFEGAMEEGQLIVDAADESVHIVLDGASVTCSYSAALYIKNAARVILTLSEGTQNSLSDKNSRPADDSIDGAIYAKAPFAVNGSGSLTVSGAYKHGISSKDAVTVAGGSISLSAPKTGLDSKGNITLTSCSLDIEAGTNGLRAGREDRAADINILSGTYAVSSAGDGIQSYGNINIHDGIITVTTGGGSSQAPVKYTEFSMSGRGTQTEAAEDDTSRKGIKAAKSISISGGSCLVDAYDDGIHSDSGIIISAGIHSISSGDDGVHAEETLLVSGGSIDIPCCYEGLEGKSVTITDGDVHIFANDDGINTASDETSEAARQTQQTPGNNAMPQKPENMAPPDGIELPEGFTPPGKTELPEGFTLPEETEFPSGFTPPDGANTPESSPSADDAAAADGTSSPNNAERTPKSSGQRPSGDMSGRGGKAGGFGGIPGQTAQDGVDITITGGTVTVSAEGDCMDSNGSIYITGGTVYVSTNRNPVIGSAESGLDCNGSLTISGGSLIGTGSSSSGTGGLNDAAIVYYGESAFDADTPLAISDSAGNILFEFTSDHSFSSVLIASPALTVGETYTLTIGDVSEEIRLTEQLLTIGESSGGMGGTNGFRGRQNRPEDAGQAFSSTLPDTAPAA